MQTYQPCMAQTSEDTSIHCHIITFNPYSIPHDQLITALWEAAEECMLGEVHRDQIVLDMVKPLGEFTFTNRFHHIDGSPIPARLHVCVQQSSQGSSIFGFIEQPAETPKQWNTPSGAISYLSLFAETLQPISINPEIEELLGFSVATWQATPDLWCKQLHPEDRERVLQERLACYHTEYPFCAEYRILTHDGRVVWLREEATPVLSSSDGPQYVQGMLIDITRRKEYEAHLEQRQKQLCVHAVGETREA